jgi:cell division protein FtsQ
MIYLFIAMGFISLQHHNNICSKVNIVITDSVARRFINRSDITDVLKRNSISCLGEPLMRINTDNIETLLLENCKVFTTVDGKVNVEISQREPIVRIIDSRGQNYYLDRQGSIIRKSNRFTPRLLVVNGNIITPFSLTKVENIFDHKWDGKTERLRDIHKLSLFIENNSFWNAQIEQLYVNKKSEFEMIPRVGPHLIILGSIDNFENKFEKLWLFYNEGLKNVGWNQYQKINLKYNDQIVCTKID